KIPMFQNGLIGRIPEGNGFPIPGKKQPQMKRRPDHLISYQQKHFLQPLFHQRVFPNMIKLRKCFQQMNGTVLILVPEIRSAFYACSSLNGCTISLQMLKVSFEHGVMTMFFEPHEGVLCELQSTGVIRAIIISAYSINSKGSAISILSRVFRCPVPRTQRIKTTKLLIPHLIS